MGFFIRSLVDWDYIYKRWSYVIWIDQKQLSQFIFSPLAQENFMASQGHKAKIMNKVNLWYVD
jgi:hypothetical protein